MSLRSAARILLIASGLTLVASPRTAAQEPKQTPEQLLDGRVDKGITDAIGAGAELYNAGDHAGCYRLYEGVIRCVTPVLDHRPALQDALRKALTTAAGQPKLSDRAFTLRGALDEAVKALRLNAAKPSLFTRLGGEPAIKAVVDDFITRTLANPKVNFTRKGTADEWEASEANVTRLKQLVTALVVEVTGGPKGYTGRDMKRTHKGMKISDAEFDAMAGDLKATLDKFKVPAAEQKELFDIIGSTRKDIVEVEKK